MSTSMAVWYVFKVALRVVQRPFFLMSVSTILYIMESSIY